MKYIKTLWSKPDRIDKVLKDIDRRRDNFPFTCLTYGEELHQKLLDKGIDSVLIHKEGRKFPPESEFGHKLWTLKMASEMFDNFIYLDHDVFLAKPIPEDIDSKLKPKRLQCSLRQYYNIRCRWTKHHPRKTPCASWIYIGDKAVANELYNIWDKRLKRSWREETAIRMWTDKQSPKGELDLDFYWNNFEPEYFCLNNSSVYRNRNRDTVWVHISNGNRRD